MTIEINQLKIISQVTRQGNYPADKRDLKIKDEEKEEIIEECLRRMKTYLERLNEI